MKNRPWSIVILALCHALAPIGNLFLNAVWAHKGIAEYLRLYFLPHNFEKNYPNLLLPVLAGIAIYACKKWSFWFYLLAMTGLFTRSYFAYLERASDLSPLILLFIFTCNALIVAYFLLPVVREIYFNPRLRWWETSPRFVFEVPAEIRWVQGVYHGKIKNISKTGAYFVSETPVQERKDYTLGFINEHHKFEIPGELIFHPASTSPAYGFKFETEHRFIHEINKLTRALELAGQVVPSRQKRPEDGFIFWLKNLFVKGKGFFPESSSRKNTKDS